LYALVVVVVELVVALVHLVVVEVLLDGKIL
jgi:hypothetical protein